MSNSRFFESRIAQFISDMNISYKTQEQLAVEQTAVCGHPYCTPDFLLDHPIRISMDGVYIDINWVEAKAYELPVEGPLVESLVTQVKKYSDAYGIGAVIFQDGFKCVIDVPGVLQLAWNERNV